MTISIGALGVATRLLTAMVGMPADANWQDSSETLINSDPQAVQVYTVVVNTEANSTVYTYTVDGVDVSITSDPSATKAEIAAALVAEHDITPHAYGLFTAATDGVDTVTLTARNVAVDVVVSDSDSRLTTTETTAPAAASEVAFGRAIVNLQTGDGEGTDTCAEVYAAKLTAQVSTLTVVFSLGEIYIISIDVNGAGPVIVQVPGNTDTATTTTDIVTAINAIMPANTVLAASSVSGTITLTAEIKGLPFVTGVGSKTGTASRLVLAHTVSGPLTDINQCVTGISLLSNATEVTAIAGSEAKYGPNQGVQVLTSGRIWVENTQTPTPSVGVYIETTAGANQGKLYSTTSSSRILWRRAKWRIPNSRVAADGLALVELT